MGSIFLSGLRDQNNGKKIGINGSRIYHVTTLLLFYLLFDSTLKLIQADQEPWTQMPFVSNPQEWPQLIIENSANSFNFKFILKFSEG